MNFRKTVNRIAESKGVKMASFARKMGMDPQKFDSYLNGNPRIDNLLKMAKAMEVSPMVLIAAFEPEPETQSIVAEDKAEYQSPEQPNQPTDMQELQFLQEQNQLLKENNTMQKEKILRLEKDLKACQDSNRVHSL